MRWGKFARDVGGGGVDNVDFYSFTCVILIFTNLILFLIHRYILWGVYFVLTKCVALI